MALAALLVSIGAFAIAALSVWYTHRADQRAAAAEARDRERFERERAASDQRLRARIAVESKGGSGTRGMAGAEYSFTVRNIGQAPARSLWLWLRDQEDRDVGTRVGGQGWTLAAGEGTEPRQLAAVVVREAVPLDKLVVWLSWSDDAGDHEEPSDCRPS